MNSGKLLGRRAGRAALITVSVGILVGLGTGSAGAVTYGHSDQWTGVLSRGGGYTAVTADVTVPRVSTYCGKDSNVVAFIGLGGWTGLPFVQNGFTVTPRGLGVWYEVFDSAGRGPVVGVPLAIRPGDRVRLGLSFSANRSVLTFRWENLTLHRAVSRTVSNAGRYYNGSTADYVVERSWYPYRGSPLARFTPITFSNAKAVRYGRSVPAYNSGSTRVTMLGARGNTVARVAPTSGTSFTTSWAGCR
jgi:hypothetical protein